MKYVDIHAHVNFSAYDSDRDAVIKRALDAGVAVINVGTQRDTSRRAVELAQAYEHVYAIVGLHPIHTSQALHDEAELGVGASAFTSRGETFDPRYYRSLLAQPRVVGIGECGLDHFRVNEEAREHQRAAFEAQVELALEVGVPLMIHTRPAKDSMRAYQETLDILGSYAREHGERLRGNFHFFAGDVLIARQVLELGFSCSFTGVVTFARSYDEVVRFLPASSMLAETDCPYVAPEPYRGQRNEPAYVTHVVSALARIRGEDEVALAGTLRENAVRLFGLL